MNTRKVNICVSRPPVHQQAKAPVAARPSGATRCQREGLSRSSRSDSRTATAIVPTPKAIPKNREVSTGDSPSLIPPASSTVHRKLVNPSTRSPRLKTSCPWSARLRAYRNEMYASSLTKSNIRACGTSSTAATTTG